MYTISKGPSKIVAKTRRGISQNLDNLRDLKKNQEDTNETLSSPKPVFQPVNGKKSHSFRAQQEAITPQHEAIIRYIHDSWTSICKEGEGEESAEHNHQKDSSKVVYFKSSEPNHDLKDFKPFDLESWWGKRLFNTITKSVP